MLYLVATPIGNLEDMTYRAVRILKEVNYVLVEDTRRSGKLLNHYDCKNKMVVYNDFNKIKITNKIIEDLKEYDIALITDCGTPGISDPGFYLVRECVKNDIVVSPIPGPSASISALISSGLPTDKFSFYGFFPKKKKKIEDILIGLNNKITSIFYESPHRILKTIQIINEKLPNSEIVIAREITKKFEEFIRGTPSLVLEKISDKQIKGEIVLLIR